MQADDDAPLKISKWPFYLGDVLLVATALAIAILGNWQLTDWEVLYCVLSVALGAGLFVLPYIVEYYLRVKEVSDDRDSHIRVLRSHIQRAEVAIESLKEDLSLNGQSDKVVITAVDKKLEQLESLATTVHDHEGRLDTVFGKLADANDQGPIEQISARLGELERMALSDEDPAGGLGEKIAGLEAKLAELTAALESVKKANPEPRPTRSPRKRREHEGGLLHRAIKEKQDASLEAVQRIIQSKAKPEPAESEESAEPEAPAEATESEVEEIVSEAEKVVKPEPEPEPEPEMDVEVDVIAGMDDVMVDDDDWDTNQIEVEPEELEARALESKADEVEPETPDEKPQVVDAPKAVSKSEKFAPPVDEAPGAAGADLFGDSVPSAPAKRRSRTKKNDSVLTVSVLIGIGNKPFLRGSGGGLSWDRGIQMDFQEIGKWRWVAPEDLEGPVELQVFRNDEDPDRKGRHTLQPGQKLEVSPVF